MINEILRKNEEFVFCARKKERASFGFRSLVRQYYGYLPFHDREEGFHLSVARLTCDYYGYLLFHDREEGFHSRYYSSTIKPK